MKSDDTGARSISGLALFSHFYIQQNGHCIHTVLHAAALFRHRHRD
jgi:hypothetical protein